MSNTRCTKKRPKELQNSPNNESKDISHYEKTKQVNNPSNLPTKEKMHNQTFYA